MIKTIIHTAYFVIIITTSIKAQENINNVLSEILKNNKSIIADQQYWVKASVERRYKDSSGTWKSSASQPQRDSVGSVLPRESV